MKGPKLVRLLLLLVFRSSFTAIQPSVWEHARNELVFREAECVDCVSRGEEENAPVAVEVADRRGRRLAVLALEHAGE